MLRTGKKDTLEIQPFSVFKWRDNEWMWSFQDRDISGTETSEDAAEKAAVKCARRHGLYVDR